MEAVKEKEEVLAKLDEDVRRRWCPEWLVRKSEEEGQKRERERLASPVRVDEAR